MAHVLVIQRNAHLGGPFQLEYLDGSGASRARAIFTVISNTRRGSGEHRTEQATAIQWTAWGPLAEHAAQHLGKGSHVNVVGRMRSTRYEQDGQTVHGMAFTAEEIDYLDSRAEREARRGRQQFVDDIQAHEDRDPPAQP